MLITLDKVRNTWIESPAGKMRLRAFVAAVLHRRNITIWEVETETNISYRSLHHCIKGKYDGIKVLLEALDYLGYEIHLVKKKPGHD